MLRTFRLKPERYRVNGKTDHGEGYTTAILLVAQSVPARGTRFESPGWARRKGRDILGLMVRFNQRSSRKSIVFLHLSDVIRLTTELESFSCE